MPIFEYACLDCDHRFETLVRGEATPECPSCHSARLQKQLSVFAVSSASPTRAHAHATPGPCGSCGDPRGPGACAYN
jgi:putative FmdB family regulatory protein